jgi:epoxyqueuosine reductase QueG
METVLALMGNLKASVKQCSKEQGFDEERLEQPNNHHEIPRELRSGEVKDVLKRVDIREGQP